MYKSIIYLAILLCTMTSCFKDRIELDYNTDENKKLVINGWINTLDEPQFISVSRTVNYLGGFVPDKVSNAVVTLEDNTEIFTLTEKEAGAYYLPEDWTAKVGDNYKLVVSFEGKEYTASHQMRACPDIENLRVEVMEETDSMTYYSPVYDFQEIPGLGDAYYITDYIKGTLIGDSLTYGGFADDAYADGLYIEDIYVGENIEAYNLGDTIIVELFSIGLETSNYLQDIELEIYRGSPFDPPPANVRTNLEGGAVGYFIISDARKAEIVIE